MHLWPSLKLRDSFKSAYLDNLEWNLRRMSGEKERNHSHQQNLLNGDAKEGAGENLPETSVSNNPSGFAVVCREVLLVLSCCYCCFGCGACIDEEDA